MLPSRDIARLLEIMAALRTPVTGCPWDLVQDFKSILPYTIEEAFEVADAIERDDRADLRDELGDLLLQVVFHARMAEEEGSFDFGGVVEAVTTKLIRRHPHVFGPARDLTPEQVKRLWAEVKAAEKAERTARRGQNGSAGLLADIPGTFPPTVRAHKLQAKAASVGFDWTHTADVLAKIREEVDEVAAAFEAGDADGRTDEIGDLLFAVVNLARHAGIDPDLALRGTNAKFERRFGFVEQELVRQGSSLQRASLDEMEALWVRAKHMERQSAPGQPDPSDDQKR
jgi:ATP diphosphatase